MQVGDLVKVIGLYMEEYALVAAIGEQNGQPFVKVHFFDGHEDFYHPTQVRVIPAHKR